MLYPQTNRCRSAFDLSGFWRIKADPDGIGAKNQWMNGFEADAEVGVPGSWNEQLAELGMMNYVGVVWYQKSFFIPAGLSRSKIYLRFGSADFHARIWLNGRFAGEHQGGYLPFECDITDIIDDDAENSVIVSIDNRLSHDTIPQGVTHDDYTAFGKQRDQTYPATVFDFFAYGGINRHVSLLAVHETHLRKIHVDSEIDGSSGSLIFSTALNDTAASPVLVVSLYDGERKIDEVRPEKNASTFEGRFSIKSCQFWSPEDPHLYTLRFEVFEDERLVDEYILDTGVREIKVTETDILLNGKPVFLKGFGKHEDFAVLGKGLSYPLIVKDFQLMKWIGANSFRTSHYPYAEEVMQLADRMGFLVIDEVPAVSLNFRHVTDRTLDAHIRSISELIERDRNHPSVICWSVANEPGIWGEAESISVVAENYWTRIFSHTRDLDPSRPITLPTFPKWREKDPVYKFCDFLSLNRYWGWYEIPGDLEKAGNALREEINVLRDAYRKPILLSEFGADTIEGLHATYPQLFTEEYQTMMIRKYFEIIESFDCTVGEHIWNFADFRTAQHYRRVVMNRKGVFNREREPKAVAFAIRSHWRNVQK